MDRKQTLEELEGENWGEPDEADTGLIQKCHRLRRKAVGTFTAADLRVMIGQQIGNKYLIPLAIEKLDDNPLLDADYYEGDLLIAVLGVAESYWTSHHNNQKQIQWILNRALSLENNEEFLKAWDTIASKRIRKRWSVSTSKCNKAP